MRVLDPARFELCACFLGGKGPLAERLRAGGVPVWTLDWRGGARDIGGAWRFWQALRGEHIALTHVHFGGRSVRLLAGKISRHGVVVHLHGRVNENGTTRLMTVSPQPCDAAIATSEAVAGSTRGMRAHVIYPATKARPAVRVRNAPPLVIGCAARLIPLKGISTLLRSAAALRQAGTDVRLQIAGDGPLRAALEVEAKQLGIADSVSFLGWLTDTDAFLSACDVYVQPSLEEAFGMAALDAMSAALPVVASRVGGLPELIEDGVSGVLVPAGEAAALSTVIGDLLADPSRRRALGAAAQARVAERFSEAAMGAAVADIYDHCLKHSQPARVTAPIVSESGVRRAARMGVRRALGEKMFGRLRGLYWAAKLSLVEYEPETAVLPGLLRPGDVCVDVGANFGQYAVLLSQAVGAEGHVHCFEPHPYNRTVLRSVLRWRGMRNLSVYPLAAGERQQELCLATEDENTAESHIAALGLRTTVVSLDDWAEQVGLERLDFLKLDVEGYEGHVLPGARRLLARFRPVILCEVNPDAKRRYGTDPATVFGLLEAAGYSAHEWKGQQFQSAIRAKQGCHNYFFLPRAAARAAAP